MQDSDPLIWSLIVQLVFIALCALFACAEIAVIGLNDAKLARLTAGGSKKASRLSKAAAQPARFLAAIQIGMTLSGFLGSAFAALNFAPRLTTWLVSLGTTVPSGVVELLITVVLTLVLTYLTLLLGSLVPKKLAGRSPEKLALALSGFILFFTKLFAPFTALLTASTNGLVRLFGVDPNADPEEVTEEEIRMMVDAGSEKGAIDPEEQAMIHNIFEFDNTTASDIMTHRTEVALLWADESDEAWAETIVESRHSVYPICLDSSDNIVGVLYTKDYFRLKDKSRDSVMQNAVRPAYFVPESVRTDVLFRGMKKSHRYFAIVLDEYGGMGGIITMNDLLEQLVGELDDDMGDDNAPALIDKLDSGTWRIQGLAPLDEVSEQLGIPLPEDDYDTFGGLVFGILGTVPEDGSTPELEAYGLSIKVTKILEHRVESATVCLSDKGKKTAPLGDD